MRGGETPPVEQRPYYYYKNCLSVQYLQLIHSASNILSLYLVCSIPFSKLGINLLRVAYAAYIQPNKGNELYSCLR